MCMVGDDDYWEFYNEYTPKARKPHRCGECRRTIEAGERYRTQGGKHDGEFVWHRTCLHCDAAAEWLLVVCDGWIFGCRQEDLEAHVIGDERYVRSAPLTRLLRWMRADWRDRAGNVRPVDDVAELASQAIAAYKNQLEREAA